MSLMSPTTCVKRNFIFSFCWWNSTILNYELVSYGWILKQLEWFANRRERKRFWLTASTRNNNKKKKRLSFSSSISRAARMACRELSPVVWLISRVQCLLGRTKLHLNRYICAKVGLTQESKFTTFSTPWGRFEREIIFCEKQLELWRQWYYYGMLITGLVDYTYTVS